MKSQTIYIHKVTSHKHDMQYTYWDQLNGLNCNPPINMVISYLSTTNNINKQNFWGRWLENKQSLAFKSIFFLILSSKVKYSIIWRYSNHVSLCVYILIHCCLVFETLHSPGKLNAVVHQLRKMWVCTLKQQFRHVDEFSDTAWSGSLIFWQFPVQLLTEISIFPFQCIHRLVKGTET